MGADGVVVDGLDRDAVEAAVRTAAPEAISHQMTALASMRSLRRFDREFASTNRLRAEGSQYLVNAAVAAGTRRLVAQSYTGWPNPRQGGRVKTEDDGLDPTPPPSMRETLDAIRALERTVMTAKGIDPIVLRYGSFYGPGTPVGPGGEIFEAVRRHRLPIVGSGKGVWSFVHIDDVAFATAIALEGGPSGVYNIVDDDPVEVSVWLPELARVIDARSPARVPTWIAQLMIGRAGVSMMTSIRGSSNAKARRLLRWRPLYPSWRDGFSGEFGRA
jgi:nucleoside-diphosphate-sugar epimerase